MSDFWVNMEEEEESYSTDCSDNYSWDADDEEEEYE